MKVEGCIQKIFVGRVGGGECLLFSLSLPEFWPESWVWASEWKYGKDATGGLGVKMGARERVWHPC